MTGDREIARLIDDLEIVRHPRARQPKLRFDPTSGRAKLIIPSRQSARAAVAWAQQHVDWIAQQRARLPQARPFVDGAAVPFGDDSLTIAWSEGGSRVVRREGDRLCLSGPTETIGRRIETWLRREALRLLSEDTACYAARAGVAVTRVSVGDPHGRWGSCSCSGNIRYNWRLVMAPEAVRRATAAHEVAHRVHMDHSRDFHALVARLYGRDPLAERRWLRSHGPALHWLGRSSSG